MIKVLISLINVINVICDIFMKASFVSHHQKNELRVALWKLKSAVEETKREKENG